VRERERRERDPKVMRGKERVGKEDKRQLIKGRVKKERSIILMR